MASTDHAALIARARRAYEWGGLRAAARVVLFIVPMMLIAFHTCGQPWATVISGALLIALTVGLLWRGEEYGAAVAPGLVGGIVPLVLPLIFHGSGHPCVGDFCWTTSVPMSMVGGAVAGAVVAARAARIGRRRAAFIACGFAVAGCAGSLGCIYGGAAALLGLAGGVVVGSLPVLALARAVSR